MQIMNRRVPTAVVVGSALLAGLGAFLWRRSRMAAEAEEARTLPERARAIVRPEERLQWTREFFEERVLPEMKPILLNLLREMERGTERLFKRWEEAVKAM